MSGGEKSERCRACRERKQKKKRARQKVLRVLLVVTILFLINVISLKSLDAPYFAPIAPFNKDYFFKTFLGALIFKISNRQSMQKSEPRKSGLDFSAADLVKARLFANFFLFAKS